MCLDEFVDMIVDAGLVDDHFGQREIGPCFNLAQQTIVNEVAADTHLNMGLLEFLEALARCADNMEVQYLDDLFPEFKAKSHCQLDKKIECMLFKLFQYHLQPKTYDEIFKNY